MQVCAIANQKGGSGKTTIAECLAVAAYIRGAATAILDLDPQGSSYRWSKRREETDPVVFTATPADAADKLDDLKKAGADWVFADTPARLAENTSVAITQADIVLIPTKVSIKDIERVGSTVDLIRYANRDVPIVVILNQVRSGISRNEEARRFLEEQGHQVCPTYLTHYVAYEDADLEGKTPEELDKMGKPAMQIQKIFRFIQESLVIKS